MIAILGKGFISCLNSSNNRNLQLSSFQKICTLKLLGVLWNVWPWRSDYARFSFGVHWYLNTQSLFLIMTTLTLIKHFTSNSCVCNEISMRYFKWGAYCQIQGHVKALSHQYRLDSICHLKWYRISSRPKGLLLHSWIGHFTVVCLVTWPLTISEAEGDFALIQSSLLFSCKCKVQWRIKILGTVLENLASTTLSYLITRCSIISTSLNTSILRMALPYPIQTKKYITPGMFLRQRRTKILERF